TLGPVKNTSSSEKQARKPCGGTMRQPRSCQTLRSLDNMVRHFSCRWYGEGNYSMSNAFEDLKLTWNSEIHACDQETPPLTRLELRALLTCMDPLPSDHARILGLPQASIYHTAARLLLDRCHPGWQRNRFCGRCQRGELIPGGPKIQKDGRSYRAADCSNP